MVTNHEDIDEKSLWRLLKQRKVIWGGHRQLKIYGTLNCSSGKRMKRKNRVFFTNEREALQQGYRPCGHCQRVKYKKWKDGFV